MSPWQPNTTARFIGLKKEGPVTQVPPSQQLTPKAGSPGNPPLWAFTSFGKLFQEPSVRPAREATRTVFLSTPPLLSTFKTLPSSSLPCPGCGLRATCAYLCLSLTILSRHLLIIPSNSLLTFPSPALMECFWKLGKYQGSYPWCVSYQGGGRYRPHLRSSCLFIQDPVHTLADSGWRKQGHSDGEKGQGRKEEAWRVRTPWKGRGRRCEGRCLSGRSKP